MIGFFRGLHRLLVDLDQHLISMFEDYGLWVYGILFAVVFLESTVTPFLPGDSVLFAAGMLATAVVINVHVLTALFAVAATLGTVLSYAIGAAVGPGAFRENRRFLDPGRLERSRTFFAEHGGMTLVVGRFVPVVRTFAPVVAGIVAMPFRRFLGYTSLGSALWVVLFVYSGYFFGEIPVVRDHFALIVLGVFILSLGPMWVEHRWRRATVRSNPLP